MAPPVERWPATELPSRATTNMLGRRRKGDIDLDRCKMFEMLQYSCVVVGAERGVPARDAPVVCRTIERMFRRCQDRKGIFIVETTAWDGEK